MTGGSHGKPCANWALPGDACPYAMGANGRSTIDARVLSSVSVRLTDTLAWLFPGLKRISGEHVSSGDEGSDYESSEEGRFEERLILRERT